MRLSIALLTIIMTAIGPSHADACCWRNWLYGRTPYVVGYAPVAAVPTTTTSVLQPTAATTAPVLDSGAYQAQRAGYYDNPSVYTGMPVTSGYSAMRVPVASVYRGELSASRNLTATNQYPDTFGPGAYASAYGSAQVPTTVAPGLPLSVATPTGVPTTALPATQVAPLFPPTPPARGGLSRFFGSGLSTGYSSAYYRAPITYYRPATTVDPVTGTTVTVQQPCTSYAQQLQRTPYSSLQGHLAAPVQPSQPSPGCSTPACGNNYSVAPAPGTYPAPGAYPAPATGGIGQASATAPAAPGQYTVPIPSTAPPAVAPGTTYGQGGYAPNAAPLTGAPPIGTGGGIQAAPQPANDLAPTGQPELRNRPQSNGDAEDQDSDARESERPSTESYWKLQNPEDSTAMIRPSQSAQGSAEPIHAPADYVSPFQRRIETPAATVNRQDFEAPQLPGRTYDSEDPSYDANWISAPVREASLARPRTYRRSPRPIQRDTTWKPARK